MEPAPSIEAPAPVAASTGSGHAPPIALPSDETLQTAGMQMIETRASAPYTPPAPPKPLGRARKPVAESQSEPLQQVETSH